MKNLTLTKEMTKRIESEEYYTKEDFIKDCKTYIKALKSGRLLYTVTHVSNSGMTRDINIKSFEGRITQGSYRNYNMMLQILGYKFASNYSNDIKVGGCGMNMLFKTNYDICRDFKRIGIITSKSCDVLSQKI